MTTPAMTRERLVEAMRRHLPRAVDPGIEAAADAILAEMAAGVADAEMLRLADDLEAGEKSDLDTHEMCLVIRALRRPDAAPAETCQCFGTTGLHASTHSHADGCRRCDLCGLPVPDAASATIPDDPWPNGRLMQIGTGGPFNQPVFATFYGADASPPRPATPSVEELARTFYLGMHGRMGADWSANESKDIWLDGATAVLALFAKERS